MIDKKYNELLKTLELFLNTYKTEQDKIPLHLNLVEEISPNENAHSRILTQLFRVSERHLKSFFCYIGGKFKEIDTAGANIECEKQRIDISITTPKGKGVIIENKICGAQDQDEQIKRYIKKLEKAGFDKNDIFIIYLTNRGGSPSKDSFPEKSRKFFIDRYTEINYRDDILLWLKDVLLPSCQYRDREMIGAITHYINFLEIRFKTLDTYANMNNKLENILLNEFNLDTNDLNGNLNTLSKKVEDINQLSNSIEKLQQNYQKLIFEKWERKICSKYESDIKSNISNTKSYFFLSMIFTYNNRKFACSIGKDQIGDQQYYVGISVRGTDDEQKYDEISKLCTELFPDTNKSRRWYVWQAVSFNSIYSEFEKVVETVKTKIENCHG